MPARRSTVLIAAAALSALVTLLAGCQGTPEPPAGSDPAGSTSSTTSAVDDEALSLVVLGDSLPYGGDDCGGCEPFGTLLGAGVEQKTGRPTEVVNLSTHDGVTTPLLLERLRGNAQMRAVVAEADLLVISTGHNDTPWNADGDDDCDGLPGEVVDWSRYDAACAAASAAAFGAVLDQLLTEVEALRGSAPTAVRVITFYNDWIGFAEASPEATVPSTQVLDAFSSTICEVATAHDAVCADTYHAFNGPDGTSPAGPLLAEDYTHPSAAGHELIAEVLLATGLTPLS